MAQHDKDIAEAWKLIRACKKMIKENDAAIKENAAEIRAMANERREKTRLLKALWLIKWNGL
jgi:hypothetical protein